MFKIEEKKDELTIRIIPLYSWLFGIIILLVLSFFIYLTFAGMDKSSFLIGKNFINFFAAFVMCCLSAFVFYSLLNAPWFVEIQINKPDEEFSITEWNLLNKNRSVYFFSQIKNLIFVEETEDLRNKVFKLILPLKDGKQTEILDVLNEGQKFEAADLLNKYIFDKPDRIPFKLTVFNTD